METSYTVGARLVVEDMASAQLTKIADKIKLLDTTLKGTQTALNALDKTAFGGLIGKIGDVIEKMKLLDGQARTTGEAIRLGFSGADASIRGTIAETKALQGEFKAAERAALSIGRVRPGVGNATGGGKAMLTNLNEVEAQLNKVETKTGSVAGAFAANFGKADSSIQLTIDKTRQLVTELQAAGAATHNVGRLPAGAGRARIGGGRNGGSFGGGHGAAGGRAQAMHEQGKNTYGEQVEVGMNLGMMGTMGFGEVTEAMKSTLEHAFELMHVQQQMKMAGIGDADVIKATSEAWKESAASGQDVVKVMEDIKELTFPLGNVEHAIAFTGQLEKMRVVLNAVTEGSGNSSKNAVYEMARAGELKGLQTPEEFSSYFDNMTKVISATGGKVTPKDFMQAMKYGRVASLGWDEEFTTKYLPTLMQSLGPTGAGTASMSLFGTLVQGKVGQKAFHQMDALGLIQDRSKLEFDRLGNPVGFQPGAIVGSDELTKNPALWAEHVLLPLIEKKFGDINDPKNKTDVVENLGGMFGNRMSAQAIAEFVLRMKSLDKDVNLLKPAYGTNGADTLLNGDPNTVLTKLGTSFTNLLTAIGGPSGKNAIELLNNLAGGLNSLTGLFNDHPNAGKLLMDGMVGVAAALAVLTGAGVIGALAFFGAGGAFFMGVTALGGVITALALYDWPALTAATDALGDFFERLKKIVADAMAWIPGFGSKKPEEFGPPMPSAGGTPSLPEQGLMQLNAYHTNSDGSPLGDGGGASDASRALEDVVYRGTLHALLEAANGGSGGGSGGGGGGGFTKASWGGGGGGSSGAGGGGDGSPIVGGAGTVDGSLPKEARALLDTISSGEAHGYNILNGGGTFNDLSHHPGGRAAGRYQDLPSTWKRIAGALGLHDFSPNSQDKGNWWLAQQDYRSHTGRDLLGDLQSHDLSRYAAIGRALHSTWVSTNGSFAKKFDHYLGAQGSTPAAKPAPTTAPEVHKHEISVMLDKKAIGKAAYSYMASTGRFPTTMGGPSPHDFYTSPGTPIVDAA